MKLSDKLISVRDNGGPITEEMLDDYIEQAGIYEATLVQVSETCGSHENWNGMRRAFLIAVEDALEK